MIDLYKNIKQKRQELGYSQEQLAQLVGYSDRTSIAKIESGKVDLQQSKIAAFAQALNCSPAELMGWSIQEPIETIAAHHDSEEWTEDELLEIEQFKEFVRMRKRQKRSDK